MSTQANASKAIFIKFLFDPFKAEQYIRAIQGRAIYSSHSSKPFLNQYIPRLREVALIEISRCSRRRWCRLSYVWCGRCASRVWGGTRLGASKARFAHVLVQPFATKLVARYEDIVVLLDESIRVGHTLLRLCTFTCTHIHFHGHELCQRVLEGRGEIGVKNGAKSTESKNQKIIETAPKSHRKIFSRALLKYFKYFIIFSSAQNASVF